VNFNKINKIFITKLKFLLLNALFISTRLKNLLSCIENKPETREYLKTNYAMLTNKMHIF